MTCVKKIVIRLPNWLGDIVMALPLAEALKEKYPESSITAVCKKPFDEVLKDYPFIDEIIPFEKPKSLKQKLNPAILRKQLKEGKFDLAVLCTRSVSSALCFIGAGIKTKIGQKRPLDFLLLTAKVKFDKNSHQRDKYKALLSPLGICSLKAKTNLHLDADYKFTSLDLDKPYIILHPGASYGSAKTWPLDSYLELAKLIEQNLDIQVVFCGDKTQQKPNLGNLKALDLTGKTTLLELCFLIQNAKAIVCNDSGPMHLADGIGTPLISLFGSTDPFKTGPRNNDSVVVFNKTSCGPCFKRVCPIDHVCMRGITPNSIFEKVKTLLVQHGSP